MRRYEGMFLFDSAVVHDFAAMQAEVQRLMERIGAELIFCRKFDERKLAYEINHRKRGTYVLTHFMAEPSKIADLERDARLSEMILRLLVLRTEGLRDEHARRIESEPAEQPLYPLYPDPRRGFATEQAKPAAATPPAATTTAAPATAETPAEPATSGATGTATATAEAPAQAAEPSGAAAPATEDQPASNQTEGPGDQPAASQD